MRTAIVTVLFACATTLVSSVPSANAAPLEIDNITEAKDVVRLIAQLNENDNIVNELLIEKEVVDTKPEAPKHTVSENETLTKIAEKHNVDWTRIFDKNTKIKDPNIISVGDELTIPLNEEQLDKREIPLPPVVQPVVKNVALASNTSNSPARKVATATSSRGNSNGNLYTAGNCTWYVKSKRPDLPNNLGNAATWATRAASQGIPTGSTPRVGAVGQRNNHVVYIESINADNTVTFSEMNYQSLHTITVRTVPANYFTYIYN